MYDFLTSVPQYQYVSLHALWLAGCPQHYPQEQLIITILRQVVVHHTIDSTIYDHTNKPVAHHTLEHCGSEVNKFSHNCNMGLHSNPC